MTVEIVLRAKRKATCVICGELIEVNVLVTLFKPSNTFAHLACSEDYDWG